MSSLYSIEKNLEKRIAVHMYTVKFKNIPNSFTLFGSNNHLSWFILDEVFDFTKNVQSNMHIIDRNIDNNSYFKFFKLQVKSDYPQNYQTTEIIFDESDFDDSSFYKIVNPSFSIKFSQTHQDFPKQIGLIETLIINNFHVLITTHHPNDLQQNENTYQKYSIFSKYIFPKDDLKTLDPRPKGIHEFIFHSFQIQADSIYFKKTFSDTTILIEYLNSNDLWNPLIHSKIKNNIYSLSKQVIYGIRFDTNLIGFKDFDFFGSTQFLEKAKIIPSSYSAFPFWGTNVNGILDGIAQYTLTSSTSSGLFEAVGQFDPKSDSQKSFLRGMYSSFDEYNNDNNTSSITFRFGFKIRLSNYLIQVPERSSFERNRNPHKWKLEGSNDEINWTLLSDIEDNIFDTDTQAVVYRTNDTSDYFSIFRIVKFDDCKGDDDVRFNQLILYRIEFFGIISPFFLEPSLFWISQGIRDYERDSIYSNFDKNVDVQPIIPIDLCNGILGSLNYFGSKIDQTETNFEFNDFKVSLVGVALINPPKDLEICMFSGNGEFRKLRLNDNVIKINENVVFVRLLVKIKFEIRKISLSKKTDGVEFLGFVYNGYRKNGIIVPTNQSLELNFQLNFQSDILHSLINFEFPKYDFKTKNNNIETSYLIIKATNPLGIQSLPYKIIESNENKKFILFDFVDSHLSLNFVAICSEKLESLNLEGSNDDGKTFENILNYKKNIRNYTLKTFIIKSKNKKFFKLIKLEKSKSYSEINDIKFYGKLELIKPKMREPLKLKAFFNSIILPGLDLQNGILNSLKNFPIKKERKKDYLLIDFIEISIKLEFVSLISFNESKSAKFLKIDGLTENDDCITIYKISNNFNEIKSGNLIINPWNEVFVSIIKISTDDKNFDFDKFEFFGEIVSTVANPTRKNPPNFKYLLNPFNGILNSGHYQYEQKNLFHCLSIEFKNKIRIFTQKVFIQFIEPIENDFSIEGSDDFLNWKKIDFDVNKASPKQFECTINDENGFQFFHIYSKSSFETEIIEFFGKVKEKVEKEDDDFIEDELSSEKVVTFSYENDHKFNGIFNNISHFFSSLSIPISLNGTKGNAEDAISLFDYNSDGFVSFTNATNNKIYIHFKLAKVKLTNYLLSFGPDLFLNNFERNGKLEASNDLKKWIVIDSIEKCQNEIEVFNINSKIEEKNGYFCHFCFTFSNPIVLRKIEFFGDYLPNNEDENLAIIKNHPVVLNKNQFSGILTSMCTFSNAFEKGLIKTNPPDLYKIIINKKKNEEVTIDSIATFEFVDSELNLTHYSIQTTMKNWTVEVNSIGESYEQENWIAIHDQENFQNCNTFKISNCPKFTKIRFINNDKKPKKLRKIEFFGTICDRKLTKKFRYDIMNGLLTMLLSYPNSVFIKEITVESSDYRYTNPIQIFDRNHINRFFSFVPSPKEKEEDSSLAFVTLRFWNKAIQIDQYSIILIDNSKIENLKIEGSNVKDEVKWEEIDFLNEQDIKKSNIIFRNSKSSKFFHFIRISSTVEFSFENIEFFGNYIAEQSTLVENEESQNNSTFEVDDKDIIAKFPFTPIKLSDKALKKGFFHNEKVEFENFIQIFATQLSWSSNPILSIFKGGNSKSLVIFDKRCQVIRINFLTTSFQLTHFFIDCKTNDTKVEVKADDRIIFYGNLVNNDAEYDDDDTEDYNDDKIPVKNVISLPIIDPSSTFIFTFQSDDVIKLGYFEFYGNLMPSNSSPNHFTSLGHNHISLSFKTQNDKKRFSQNFSLMNSRLKFALFTNGVISRIAKEAKGTLINNKMISCYERYEEVENSPVYINPNSPSEFTFGNSPQVTFDFGSCSLQVEYYALDTEMKHWVIEGSQDGGKSWFTIDIQYSKESKPSSPKSRFGRRIRPQLTSKSSQTLLNDERSKLFYVKKKEAQKRSASLIRVTNMDSLFEGFYDKPGDRLRHPCGIGKIEFYGDFEVKLPIKSEVKLKDDEGSSLFEEEVESFENFEDENNLCKPQKNLIFFPPFAKPNLQTPTKKSEKEKKKDNEKEPMEYDYYDYYGYEYEYEKMEEDAESDDNDESSSSSLSDIENILHNELGVVDFSNVSLIDILRLLRNVHLQSDDDIDFDIDLDFSDS